MKIILHRVTAKNMLLAIVCTLCVIVFAIILGACSTNMNSPGETEGTAEVDVRTNAIDQLDGMFDNGTKIWYQKSENSEYSNLTKTSFDLEEDYFDRYKHLFDCVWEQAEPPDTDTTAAAGAIGDDEEHCFYFLLGSDTVIYMDGEKASYYRAYIKTPKDSLEYPMAPLSENLMREYSDNEVSASNLPLKDNNFKSKEDIAYAFFEQKTTYLKSMTPENWYALTDYQILDLKVEEDGGDKFIFWVETAIKPKVYANDGLPWIAGSGWNGEGEWTGYIIKTGLYRLDLINGYWECIIAGAGDITLDAPST